MKTSFKQQATSYDCVPTSFVNALVYLFEREEIPPLVIQRIYMYCLDSVADTCSGTSGLAIQHLADWLNNYSKEEGKNNKLKFQINAKYLECEDVDFKKGGPISTFLKNDKKLLLLRLRHQSHWHYVLALYIKDDWLFCYDPMRLSSSKLQESYQILDWKDLHSPNLKISLNWLKESTTHQYQLGSNEERECLLIERI